MGITYPGSYIIRKRMNSFQVTEWSPPCGLLVYQYFPNGTVYLSINKGPFAFYSMITPFEYNVAYSKHCNQVNVSIGIATAAKNELIRREKAVFMEKIKAQKEREERLLRKKEEDDVNSLLREAVDVGVYSLPLIIE